jgi:hypothetical protein
MEEEFMIGILGVLGIVGSILLIHNLSKRRNEKI